MSGEASSVIQDIKTLLQDPYRLAVAESDGLPYS